MKFIEVLKDLMIDKEMNLKVLAELTGKEKRPLFFFFFKNLNKEAFFL